MFGFCLFTRKGCSSSSFCYYLAVHLGSLLLYLMWKRIRGLTFSPPLNGFADSAKAFSTADNNKRDVCHAAYTHHRPNPQENKEADGSKTVRGEEGEASSVFWNYIYIFIFLFEGVVMAAFLFTFVKNCYFTSKIISCESHQ